MATTMQPTTGEVLGRSRRDRKFGIGEPVGLPPIELHNALRSHTPSLQMRTDSKGGDKRHVELRQLAHRRKVQMIVVVVGHDDRVDRRKRPQRDWNRLKPLGPDQARRRGAPPPHRVGQDPLPVDLYQDRGVPEPGGAQARARCPRPYVVRIDGRQFTAWNAPLTATQKLRQRRCSGTCVSQTRQHGMNIAKALSGPERRGAHAFEAQTVRFLTQGFHAGAAPLSSHDRKQSRSRRRLYLFEAGRRCR